MPIKTDADMAEEVMEKERRDYHYETLDLIDFLVTPAMHGGFIVYVVYSYKRPASRIVGDTNTGGTDIPAREGVRWVVRPDGGGGASGGE